MTPHRIAHSGTPRGRSKGQNSVRPACTPVNAVTGIAPGALVFATRRRLDELELIPTTISRLRNHAGFFPQTTHSNSL